MKQQEDEADNLKKCGNAARRAQSIASSLVFFCVVFI